jgi:probable phosphoglycerate mutase
MRHGTCDDGLCRPRAHARPDSPLTIGGIVEAELTAHELRRHRWQPSLIVPSPLRRARQTASIVARTFGARVAEPIATFAEWRAPLCVLGRTPAQYPPEYVAWREQRTNDVDSALMGGESLRAFAERAAKASAMAHELATQHGPVLVVSHRLLIGAVVAIHRGHRQPAEIFGFASDFRLAPAHLWAARTGESL